MIKKLLIAFVILSVVSPVLAQEDEVGGPPPLFVAAHRQVVDFLQLAEEQVAAWDEAYLLHRENEAPLQEEMRLVQEELEALFAAGEPDPELVGELVIERHGLGEELAEVHQIYHEAVLEILDEEQTDRLYFIARADKVEKIIPAFKLFELIRR